MAGGITFLTLGSHPIDFGRREDPTKGRLEPDAPLWEVGGSCAGHSPPCPLHTQGSVKAGACPSPHRQTQHQEIQAWGTVPTPGPFTAPGPRSQAPLPNPCS